MADSILRNPDGQFTSERARQDGRVCGRRQPDVVIEARRQKLYKRQLEGKTTRQLVLEHAATEGIGIDSGGGGGDWSRCGVVDGMCSFDSSLSGGASSSSADTLGVVMVISVS